MSRIYYVAINAVAATAAQDIFEILPADDKPVVLHGFEISQSSDTDSEQLQVLVKRLPATVTSGTGGSSATIQKRISSDANASFAAEINNTSRASTSTTAQPLFSIGWNVLSGCGMLLTPETRPIFVQGEALIIGLEGAPADSITLNGYLIVEELG